MRSAQSFGECGGGEDHEGYYIAIADMLRAVDSCTFEKAGVVRPNDACDFEEQGWPLRCVYPWEIRRQPSANVPGLVQARSDVAVQIKSA